MSDHNAPFDDSDTCSTEKLIHAVQWGDLHFVENAIEKLGFSADTSDIDNCSLLHWAAINNRLDVARFLILKGANVNAVGGNNCEIPLQWAARNSKCCRMVHLLISEGANITHKSVYGLDALFIATQSNHVNLAFILLNAGADPNTIGSEGDTPLYALLKKYNSSTKEDDDNDHIEMQRLLVRAKASVAHKDANGKTSMHILTEAKITDFKSVFLVYDAGGFAVMSEKDNNGLTPYKIATKRKHSRLLRFFGEAYVYKNFPSYFPIVCLAFLFAGFFVSLYFFGWFWGPVAYIPGYMTMGLVIQNSIARAASRASCGFAWGIIVSIVGGYFAFFIPQTLSIADFLFLGLAILTASTLTLTTVSNPHFIYGDSSESRDKIVEQILQSETAGAAGTFKLCSTCWIDKSQVSMHCSKCNKCVVCLDHHCPFVCNCVGRGNRRVFVLFAIFSSTGCGLFSSIAFTYEHAVLCKDSLGRWGNIFAVQQCVAEANPSMFLISWLGVAASFMISLVVISQLSLIAGETTTFEVLKKGNNGLSGLSCRAFRNLVTFFANGSFPVHQCSAGDSSYMRLGQKRKTGDDDEDDEIEERKEFHNV